MDKYKLTAETKIYCGVTVFRIQALKNFGKIKKGSLGGWVESMSNLSQQGGAWVSGEAYVYSRARVYGEARVSGRAHVSGNARVYGEARVFGRGHVSGNARVYGRVRVYGLGCVFGNARVYGRARVYGEARVSGKGRVYDEARVYGKGWVYDNLCVSGEARVTTTVVNITGLKYNITICDNTVQVGCMCFKKSEIDNIKYSSVKRECTLKEFEYLKNIIKTI